MALALKKRGSKLIRVPSNKLGKGCPVTSGPCCVWPPPTPTTMVLTVDGFFNYGTDTCSSQRCAVATKHESHHDAANGTYSTTVLSIINGQSVSGRFILGDGTYANPGILIHKEFHYGINPDPCGVLSGSFEEYITELSATLACTSINYGTPNPNCPGPCGRFIDGFGITTQRWNVFGTPTKAGIGDMNFHENLDRFTTCGFTFIPSTTGHVWPDQIVVSGCKLHTVLQNLSLTVSIG